MEDLARGEEGKLHQQGPQDEGRPSRGRICYLNIIDLRDEAFQDAYSDKI